MFTINHKKVFGVELSNASVKVIELTKKGTGFSIVGMQKVKLPPGTTDKGIIKDPETVARCLKEALISAKPHRIKTPYLVASLPEAHTFIRTINLPKMPAEELQEAAKWETEQHIPLSSDKVYLDFQKISDFKATSEYLVAASPKPLVDGYLKIFKSLKLKPVAFEPEAISLTRAIVPDQDKQASVLVIDLGKTKSIFAIQTKGIVYFTSSLDISGDLITKKIAAALQISPTDAEKEKISCCSPEMTEREQMILRAIHSVLDQLSEEIDKIIDYFHSHFTDEQEISKIILCGGGANLKGVTPYLGLKLKRKVMLGNPFVNVPHKKDLVINKDEAQSYIKAIGLALRDFYFSKSPKKNK